MGPLCDDISKIIGEKYTIVYMDFTNEVKDFSECLKKKGEIDVKCFHGKGMTNTQKKEIVEDFINEEFQVLCATES